MDVKLGTVNVFMAGNLPQEQNTQPPAAAATPQMTPTFANETYQAPQAPQAPQHQPPSAAQVPTPPQGWLDQMAEADQHLPF